MFCEKCGQQIKPDSKFCEGCGTPTPGVVQPPIQQPNQQPVQQPIQQPIQQPVQQQFYASEPVKKKSGCAKFLIVIGIIAAIGIFVVVGLFAVGMILGNQDISQIAMASEVDSKTNEPITKTNDFQTDSPVINCTLLSKMPIGSSITAEWFFGNDTVTTITYVTKLSPEKINFSLSIPDAGWPVGQYRIDLSIGEKFYKSVKFEVKGITAVTSALTQTVSPTSALTQTVLPTAAAVISSVTDVKTSLQIDSTTLEPELILSVFPTTAPQIYVTFKINELPIGTKIRLEWIYSTSNLPITAWEADSTERSQNVQCSLNKPDADWPVGEYEVKISVGGKYETSAKFSVK